MRDSSLIMVIIFFSSVLLAPVGVTAKSKIDWVEKNDLPKIEAFLNSQFSALSPRQVEKRATEMKAAAKDERSLATAFFIRGLARYRLGKYVQAESDLGDALKGPIINRDLAAFLVAESLFSSGRLSSCSKSVCRHSEGVIFAPAGAIERVYGR